MCFSVKGQQSVPGVASPSPYAEVWLISNGQSRAIYSWAIYSTSMVNKCTWVLAHGPDRLCCVLTSDHTNHPSCIPGSLLLTMYKCTKYSCNNKIPHYLHIGNLWNMYYNSNCCYSS